MSVQDEEVDTFARRHVRVWFGNTVIAQHVAEPQLASRYEQAMRRRFAGLRVSNDPVLLTDNPTS